MGGWEEEAFFTYVPEILASLEPLLQLLPGLAEVVEGGEEEEEEEEKEEDLSCDE